MFKLDQSIIYGEVSEYICYVADGIKCVDSGWLTFQTEIRLRLHYSVKPPVSITKMKFKKSRFR